ncbi:hypothetical protein EV182_001327, partial [Spiromyces aspiralis]
MCGTNHMATSRRGLASRRRGRGSDSRSFDGAYTRERQRSQQHHYYYQWQSTSSRDRPDSQYAIPHNPSDVLKPDSAAAKLLNTGALAVTRQIEMLNIFIGYEQANRYAILDQHGNAVGFMLEEDTVVSTLGRQLLRLHRPFRVTIMDLNGDARRPFCWLNSYMYVYNETGTLIGESHQEWHPWRRRYNLFRQRAQFARIDAPFLAWEFDLKDEDGQLLGSVSRKFTGFGRELFTDMGHYSLYMDPTMLELARSDQPEVCAGSDRERVETFAGDNQIYHIPIRDSPEQQQLSLDERAVMLGCAISIDFDYFSRHS